MSERVWDRFLTVGDREQVSRSRVHPWGFGATPALLLIDLYRAVFGDRPQPLPEAVGQWPASCGLAGWEALPHIQRLLGAARDAGIPVIHATGSVAIPGWHARHAETTADTERRRRGYEIIEPVAPRPDEPVIHKAAPSAFWGTPLAWHLNELGVDTLVVAGESTSGCVRATVVDGRTHRYRVTVVEECVFDRTEASHAINLFDMHQKYADVIGIDEAVGKIDAHARREDGPGAGSAATGRATETARASRA